MQRDKITLMTKDLQHSQFILRVITIKTNFYASEKSQKLVVASYQISRIAWPWEVLLDEFA